MNKQRTQRIAEEIKKIISMLLINGLKDPRVNELTTVSRVDVTRDLSYANIYFSVIGEDKDEVLDGLNSAKGFIRREIGSNLKTRIVPELIFHIDDSVEKSIYMNKLIEQVRSEDDKNETKI